MKQFFEDSTGKLSMMRLGFYTLILTAVFMCLKPNEKISIIEDGKKTTKPVPKNDVLILGVLGIVAALKWKQKQEEK